MIGPTTQFGLYFSLNGNTVRIPVNPEEFSITHTDTNTTYNVLDIGEIIIPREPGLRRIQWDAWLPATDDDPYVLTSGRFREPEYYINLWRQYKADKAQPRFIVNRYDTDDSELFDTNIQVVVSEFELIDKGGEVGDIYYTMSLTEYRPHEAEIVSIRTATNSSTASASTTPQRQVDNGVISVGDTVIVNGPYYNSSYAEPPFYNANNLRTTVTRIVKSPKSGQTHPYHVGTATGWVKRSQLTKV